MSERDAMRCRACGREERASEGYPVPGLRHLHLQHVRAAGRGALPRLCRQGAAARGRPAAGTPMPAPRRERRRPAPLCAGGRARHRRGGRHGLHGGARRRSAPMRGACAVFGRATGTRELALLEPGHLVDRVDAVLISGGSAYGLAAADGVMRWLEEQGRGFPVGAGVVPIVPGAVLFDLLPLGRFDARPTPQMGYDACAAAVSHGIGEGSVGAGTGLTVGKALGARRRR